MTSEDKKPVNRSSRNEQSQFTGGKAAREAGRKGGKRSRAESHSEE